MTDNIKSALGTSEMIKVGAYIAIVLLTFAEVRFRSHQNAKEIAELKVEVSKQGDAITDLEKGAIARAGEFNLLRSDIARNGKTLEAVVVELRRLDGENKPPSKP